MKKLKNQLLKQMAGQKIKQHCPNCKNDTVFLINKLGIAKCTELECEHEFVIDLTDSIKSLKSWGAFVE